jgi:ubiquinone/menaquinone biosynthesis C-methylase UbiE
MICDPGTDPTVAFFDETAETYHRQYFEETPGGYALRIRRMKVLDFFDKPYGKVIDVGCGPGVMAESMLNLGCTFWGVDPSPKMIDIARGRFNDNGRVHLSSGNAMNLDFSDGFFDAALCMGVIDALSDRRQALREMLRVLKPGGTLIITFSNLLNPYAWWKLYAFYPVVGLWHRLRRTKSLRAQSGLLSQAKVRALFTQRGAHDLLLSEGAEVVESVGYYHNIFLSPLDEIWPSGALWVTRKFEEGNWPKPQWLSAGWIIKARKTQ